MTGGKGKGGEERGPTSKARGRRERKGEGVSPPNLKTKLRWTRASASRLDRLQRNCPSQSSQRMHSSATVHTKACECSEENRSEAGRKSSERERSGERGYER